MSKKRNQVLFSKPEDPKFLKLIKQEAGYRDGPTVDTKRAKYENGDFSDDDDEDYQEKDEERPQIVVVRNGDLTAEEANAEQQRLEIESNTKPADLSERIVFKAKSKKAINSEAAATGSSKLQADTSKSTTDVQPKPKKSKSKDVPKLSFAFEDDDDEE